MGVTILILVDGFLQLSTIKNTVAKGATVTILILVDGFLQFNYNKNKKDLDISHNPYFSRWFSAIFKEVKHHAHSISHNPYFSRWFSAISYA